MIKKTIETFSIVEKKLEVCYLKKGGGRIRIAYDNAEDLANKVVKINAQPTTQGIYFLPNESMNLINASKADEVIWRNWLIIDVDNEYRPKDESLQEEVLEEFRRTYLPKIEEIIDFSQLPCLLACSGNGWHICLKANLGVDETTENAVKDFYATLAQIKIGAGWKTDSSMAKRSQITKFYGTTARKGEARESYIEWSEYNLEGEVIELNKLLKITEMMKEKLKIEEKRAYIEELLTAYQPDNNLVWGNNYVQLEKCPMCDEHTTDYSATIYFEDGYRFHCFGDHCKNDKGEQLHTWAEFYEKITGMPWEKKKETPKFDGIASGKSLADIVAEGNWEGYPTGIQTLDAQLGGGLKKRTYSVLTGNPGEGKSTMCVQMINNLLKEGYTVGYYQSDLNLENTKKNLVTQSGMSKEEYTEKYKDQIRLFDNEEFSSDTISTAGNFDVFFIDNMSGLIPSKSDYDFQKQLAHKIKEITKEKNNHIVWVCHQRKHDEFNSMDKIEGTSDISRYAYTIIDVTKCDKNYWDKVKAKYGRNCDAIEEMTESCVKGTPIKAKLHIFKNQEKGKNETIPLCFSQDEKTFTPYQE